MPSCRPDHVTKNTFILAYVYQRTHLAVLARKLNNRKQRRSFAYDLVEIHSGRGNFPYSWHVHPLLG